MSILTMVIGYEIVSERHRDVRDVHSFDLLVQFIVDKLEFPDGDPSKSFELGLRHFRRRVRESFSQRGFPIPVLVHRVRGIVCLQGVEVGNS